MHRETKMTDEPLCPTPALRGEHDLNQQKEAVGADFGAAEESPTSSTS